MLTTVYFASNRVLAGAPELVGSYSKGLQPPSDSANVVFGTAFVSGIDISTNRQGKIDSIQNVELGKFASDPAGDLAGGGRDLLIFIHGFDNTFEDAITRAAFNREWLAASGVATADMAVLAFSWPSLGKVVTPPILRADYLHDQQMARLSGTHLMGFFQVLKPIVADARAAGFRTFLLVHSMGHVALQSGVENWFLHGDADTHLFDFAVLAAGDCGFDAFDQPGLARLSGLSRLAERIAIYYSQVDNVLQVSFGVNLVPRLGQDGPRHRTDTAAFPATQFRMVNAAGFRDYDFNFFTSHQYYRMSPLARASIIQNMDPAAWV
ncbi:MAG: alpha/beta hydrolase [Rhodospirillales bacterium]